MAEIKYCIARPSFLGNEKKYLTDTIESGWISSIGSYIEKFENQFAAMHGTKHAIATHNGTIALHLALAACGITEGDEVIVPDLTFIATANSVRYCHAKPVLTDVNLDDWNLSPASFAQGITSHTRAVIPVHLYGNPVLMEEILAIAREKRLLVIEDCAEALGAQYQKRLTGTFSDIACFSFFGNKIITTGEGGMCLTQSDELAERMRILRDHGMNRQKKYWYDHPGFNYRMTNMQAAIGLAQLEQLPRLMELRDEIHHWYQERLKGAPGIIFQQTHGQRHVNWIFTIRISNADETRRDRVMELLREAGVDTRPVFYPIHRMPFLQQAGRSESTFPNSEQISREGISLPTYIGLTREDIGYICDNLLRSIEKAGI